jgi:hypothetical protein
MDFRAPAVAETVGAEALLRTAAEIVKVTGTSVVADAWVPSEAIVALTEQVPATLEIVTVLPLIVQPVDEPIEYVISPLPAEGPATTV